MLRSDWLIRTVIVPAIAAALCMATPLQSAELLENRLSAGGDFRYRQEVITRSDETEQIRHRLRLRLNVAAVVNQDIDVRFTIASGTDNVGANNQTLDDAFDTKPLSLYQAYVSMHPKSVPGLTIDAGKVLRPFYLPAGSELIWYVSLAPEGVAARYEQTLGAWRLRTVAGGFWLEERPTTKDSYLSWGQATLSLNALGDTRIAVGGGFYGYGNMKGQPALHVASGSGNVLTESGAYAEEFGLVEGFLECGSDIFGLPTTVAVHVVENIRADSLSTGFWVGGRIGQLGKAGSWRLGYDYRRVEADAVVGWLADALFAGGQSDARGHRAWINLRLWSEVTLVGTYFHNWTGISGEQQRYYRRGQVDLLYSF